MTGKNKDDLMTNSLFPTQKTFTAATYEDGSSTRTGREQQRGNNDQSEVEEVNKNIKQLKNKKNLNESVSDKLAELTQMKVKNLKSKMKEVRPGQSSIQCINTSIFLEEQSSELVMQGTPLVQYQYTERKNKIHKIQNKKISKLFTNYNDHQIFATTNLKTNPMRNLSDSFQSIGDFSQQSQQKQNN
eukprot:403351848